MNRVLEADKLPTSTALLAVLALAGCSLAVRSSRPDPTAQNVGCALEYQPATEEGTGHDLLFLAWSSPYRHENFYMSLPDNLFHRAFAPGRHLENDMRIEGASCDGPSWGKGFRLPATPSSEKWILCKREGLEAVLFEVETKWGVCRERIPAGDSSPRGLDGIRRVKELPRLGG